MKRVLLPAKKTLISPSGGGVSLKRVQSTLIAPLLAGAVSKRSARVGALAVRTSWRRFTKVADAEASFLGRKPHRRVFPIPALDTVVLFFEVTRS
jgi:hypothetical protein